MLQIDIYFDVSPVQQPRGMSCWAAAAAMLLSWMHSLPTNELQACQSAADIYVAAF
ncbi:papain-like cysteine protease family protein [Zoogloea sp.]|uniref:papain-like cysteine protease family protein n=1 Tax=Zoogloea sp. TaxID=49181 RepID=UPI0035AD7E94